MTTPIRASAYDASRNLIGRPNVSVDADDSKGGTVPHTQAQIYDTLDMLVSSKPNWRFVATDFVRPDSITRVYTDFNIYEDDEFLGKVTITHKGRSYKIKVSNDRINAARERGTGYYTEDPVKAQLRIRKTFFKANNDERIEKAAEIAESLLKKENQGKAWEYRHAKDALLDKAGDFAAKNMEAYLQAYPNLLPKKSRYDDARANYGVVKKIKEAFDNGKSVVVAFDGTHYIVKSEEGVKTLSDETLPYEMRRKVGLLKLVQDGQMISDVGCRVDGATFVLLPEDEKEQA
jgi:hypothetical protein